MTFLIIDLRDNPGGMLEEARKIVGYFAPAQVVVYEKDKQETKPLKAPVGRNCLRAMCNLGEWWFCFCF